MRLEHILVFSATVNRLYTTFTALSSSALLVGFRDDCFHKSPLHFFSCFWRSSSQSLGKQQTEKVELFSLCLLICGHDLKNDDFFRWLPEAFIAPGHYGERLVLYPLRCTSREASEIDLQSLEGSNLQFACLIHKVAFSIYCMTSRTTHQLPFALRVTISTEVFIYLQ